MFFLYRSVRWFYLNKKINLSFLKTEMLNENNKLTNKGKLFLPFFELIILIIFIGMIEKFILS